MDFGAARPHIYRMRLVRCLLPALGLALISASCFAARVSTEDDVMTIRGTIRAGDAARVRDAMTPETRLIVVTSDGGDMQEGIAIAEILRDRGVDISVDRFCMSACANYLFAAGKRRFVPRNSVVCFHGTAPRSKDEVREFFWSIAERNGVAKKLSQHEIDNLAEDGEEIYATYAGREAALYRSLNLDAQILTDSRLRMVPRIRVDDTDGPERFMRTRQIVWCPSPDTLNHYGIATEHMWYPESERALYQVGRAYSLNFVLVAYSAAEAERGGIDKASYIVTRPYDSGANIQLNLADIFNNLGIVAAAKGNNARAIEDYDTAIRLSPDAPWSYNNRGVARAREGDYDEAVADYDKALKLRSRGMPSRGNRAAAYDVQGRFAESESEFTGLLRDGTRVPAVYTGRGRARFNLGRYTEAAEDFRRSLALDGNQPYTALWLHLARLRNGESDAGELTQNAAGFDRAVWPAPVIAFFKHELSADQLLQAVQTAGDEKDRREHGCEASFYLGQDALARGRRADAEALLRGARATCPPIFIEYQGAETELRRMAEAGNGQ